MKQNYIWQTLTKLTSLTLLSAAVIASITTTASAATPLTYGSSYHIQNGYQSWTGGFLDTRGRGCEGNVLCVSTSSFPDRDGATTSTWVLLSADGKNPGSQVLRGDRVHLANKWPEGNGGNPLYQPYGGFLDTRGINCESNPLCVSTAWNSNREKSGSGTWTIEASSDTIYVGQAVYLRNNYGEGRFLDTRSAGCDDNLLCVSASVSSNRDSGSGTWRFKAR